MWKTIICSLCLMLMLAGCASKMTARDNSGNELVGNIIMITDDGDTYTFNTDTVEVGMYNNRCRITFTTEDGEETSVSRLTWLNSEFKVVE